MSFVRPIAPTSDAGAAERNEQLGPKTFRDSDFSDLEESVPWWRALAVLGAFGLVEGLLFWMNVTVTTTRAGSFTSLPGALLVLMIAIGLGGIVAAALGFGAEAVACFVAAAVGFGVFFGVNNSSNGIPGQGLTLSGDHLLFGILLAVGALVLALGAAGMARVYVTLARAAPVRPA
jgi:hypothetical protein